MKKYEMIKEKKVFTDIIHTNNFNLNKYYVIYYKEKDNLSYPTFGIAISNKYGNAVERNYAKRVTRNIIDKLKYLFKNNSSYIIMIRKQVKNAKYKELYDAMLELLIERNTKNEKQN